MRGVLYLMLMPPIGPALVVLAALCLAGCQTASPAVPVERVVFQAPVVPQTTLRCSDQPVPGLLRTEADVERYATALAAAGQDCRTKLGSVRGSLEGTKP